MKRLTWLLVGIIVAWAPVFGFAAEPEVPREHWLWPLGEPGAADRDAVTADSPLWAEREVDFPSITPFLPDAAKRTGAAVVICPGGGYSGLSMIKEGREVAEWLQSHGIAGIVLRYRCGGGPHQQPIPLQDAQRAIQLVRTRADSWGIDPKRVGILGFSAGGHLASTAATMFNNPRADSEYPVDQQSSRPDFAALIYPVITMSAEEVVHKGSRRNLLGEDPSEELRRQWSTDLCVTAQTPPTFMVHASDDRSVPAKNSLLFYEALLAHNVPAELHLYEVGGHGFGMFQQDRPADKWPELFLAWLKARKLVLPLAGGR